jgi:YD repeat-containing protein
MGRVIKTSNPTETSASGTPSQWTTAGDDAAAGWIYTEQAYDWKGRPLVTTNQNGTTKTASYSGCGCAGGEVVTLTDEGTINGGVTKKRQQKIYSDVLGRTVKTEVLNWEGGSVYTAAVNTYNALNQITLIRQYAGAEGSGSFQDTTMTYDGFGRLQNRKLPEQSVGTAATWTYNSDDTVNSITDARGASQTFTYNARHLATSITYAAPGGIAVPSAVTYSYDAAGIRTLMTDGHGSQTYQYDQLSRLTQETRQFAVGTFTIGYAYNLAGQLMSVTDPFNDSVSYTRNVAGQLKTVTGSPYAGIASYITDVSYRAWGAPKSISYPGTTATTAYNSRRLPTQYRHTANSSGASVMREDYGYFADGELGSLTDLDDTPGSNPPVTLRFLSRSWGYDQMGRVIGSGGTGSGSMPGVPYSQSYTYDAFGNMTSRVGSYYNYTFQQPSSDTATYTNNRRTNWSYNADGQVVSTPLTSTDQPRATTYDAAGRMLTSVETGQFNTITYSASYDGDGQVVFESSNTSPGTFESGYIVRSSVLEGEVFTRLDQSGNKKTTHVPAEGLLFAVQRSSGAPGAFVEFIHRNPHEVTETNKAVYDPLGNYMPFQGSGDPRPPAGSFTSATLRGLAASQANPYSSAVGCLIDGLPTTCDRVAKAISRGEAKTLVIDGRGQNPNVALANMGWFLTEFPTNGKGALDRPRLRSSRPGPRNPETDPYKLKLIDQEVNWAFRLMSFQQQNPAATPTPRELDCHGFADHVQMIADNSDSKRSFMDELARTFTGARNSSMTEMLNNSAGPSRVNTTDDGFRADLRETQDSHNQARHYVGGFIAAAHLGEFAGRGFMNARETPGLPDYASDTALNRISTSHASDFIGSAHGIDYLRRYLARRIRIEVCGDKP